MPDVRNVCIIRQGRFRVFELICVHPCPSVVKRPFLWMSASIEQPIPNTLLEQPDFAVPAAMGAEIDELITHYPKKRSASLMVLHAMQEHFGFISHQAVGWIAAKLELQPI